MSISNYAELQTAIGNYLHRSDLSAQIPDFISLAEVKLNRRLRLRAMENIATGTVSATVALPTGYVETKALTVTSGGTTYPLEYITPNSVVTESATAIRYSIVGENIVFVPSGSGETYSLTYYKKFDPLSSGVNWLITNAPDVYLYASLLEASPYIKDNSNIPVWAQAMEDVVAQLMRANQDDRYGSALVMRTA